MMMCQGGERERKVLNVGPYRAPCCSPRAAAAAAAVAGLVFVQPCRNGDNRITIKAAPPASDDFF